MTDQPRLAVPIRETSGDRYRRAVNHKSLLPLWLRREVAERKWIVWVAVAFVVLAAVSVAVTLLVPHHTVNTFLQYGEKANGRESAP